MMNVLPLYHDSYLLLLRYSDAAFLVLVTAPIAAALLASWLVS